MTDVTRPMPYRDFLGACTMDPEATQLVELRGVATDPADPMFRPCADLSRIVKVIPYTDLISTVSRWRGEGRSITTVRLCA